MKEDQDAGNLNRRSWIDRLGQALLGEPKDHAQLIELLRDAQTRGLFDVDAQAMMEGVLHFAEMRVRDIMIPRSQMVVVNRDAKPEEMLNISIESGHSRFPVIGDSRDEVVGVLLAKDLLRHYSEQESSGFSVRELLRQAFIVPESKRLNVLLKDFRNNRNHIAIVVDEYGGVAGMVTIEDVLEQIVGDIEDEHDIDEDSHIRKLSESKFTVKALTSIDEFNECLGTAFDVKEFDTIGGLVTDKMGHLPARGETLELGSLHFKVLNADNRRIRLFEVVRLHHSDAAISSSAV